MCGEQSLLRTSSLRAWRTNLKKQSERNERSGLSKDGRSDAVRERCSGEVWGGREVRSGEAETLGMVRCLGVKDVLW